MSQFKILQALEEAIFEIMAWIMLLPKTLIEVLFKPRAAIAYVNNEMKKERAEERFDEFLSPVIFWILVAVIPLTYALLSESELQQNGVLAVFLEPKIVYGAATAALLLLVYLMGIELINNRPIRKSTLKRMFYVQCYITSPAVLIITLVLKLTTTLQAVQFYMLASILFLIFYETLAMKMELKVSWTKALVHAILPLIAVVLIVALFALLAILTRPASV